MTPPTAPPRLRIAVLSRKFSTTGGGAERYSVALVEQLAAWHELHVFAQETEHGWPGVTYHRIGAAGLKPRWVNQLWFAARTWQLTRRGFDVVHSHENTWHGDVQTVHVLPVRHNLFAGRAGWRQAARALKAATSPRLLAYLGLEHWRYAPRPGRQVVAASETLRDVLVASYPACAPALAVVTPGIALPPAPATPARRAEARAQLGLPRTGRCLLFVANDCRKKGLGTLLDALARLPADVCLAVAGSTAQHPAFAAQARALGLAARVFFLGPLKDMAPAYEAADCLAHPTLEDTFAMAVLEAMAHGVPVVVSAARYCGIAALLQHGVNAAIVDDPRDAAQLHAALAGVLDDAARHAVLGAGARHFARAHQWHEVARRQERVYFSVLAGKAAAAAGQKALA